MNNLFRSQSGQFAMSFIFCNIRCNIAAFMAAKSYTCETLPFVIKSPRTSRL